MKKVTIYDVAREAGVSLATVSRVINGSSVVREKTKQKVLDVIEKLDFKPNEVARGLATSKTTSIAIVFPQSLFAHVKDMIGGIGDTGRHLDYNINMYTTDDLGDENAVKEVTEKIVKSRADGVILFNNDQLQEEIDIMAKYKIPTVVIGTQASNDYLGSIYVNAKQIAYEIIDRYLEKGKNDILFVNPKQNLIKSDDLIMGIEKAYQKHNLQFDFDKQVMKVSTHYEKSYPQFLEYFKNHKHDLVFCGYDKEAVAVVNAAIDNHIMIPDDMEVIGLMNTSYASMCRPSLSSVHVPVYDMGALAVRLLTKILNDEEIDTKEVPVTYMRIPRKTTKNF
ncbi:LacI family DNA-binding transcriptional regulator [Coprobacillus sp. AF33-1AC]|uniref:LacI family DNA-binding transcriptional regulator n=1 Tax=Coprobacillus sp. AF33-1AC TaxID=2292032 RepID=UPI000E46DE18|nr:LacI family DNA-binding transcriptional regulator [Coprobacillus sp. AF33-1AC]RHM62589.1 LacI family transcriptional regulator [Coprobacillus sp. AF33-1AC]